VRGKGEKKERRNQLSNRIRAGRMLCFISSEPETERQCSGLGGEGVVVA